MILKRDITRDTYQPDSLYRETCSVISAPSDLALSVLKDSGLIVFNIVGVIVIYKK